MGPGRADLDSDRTAALDAQTIGQAVQVQRLRMHTDNSPWFSIGVMVIALLFVALQWQAMQHWHLMAWLGMLLLIMAWRGVLRWQHLRHAAHDDRLLQQYRATCAVHGLLWAAVSTMPAAAGDGVQLIVLFTIVSGVATSNFVLNAFDPPAALLFGVPALCGLAWYLIAHGDGVHAALGGGVLMALVYFSLVTRRAGRIVVENEALRLAEARQNHLLRALIATTHEGFWSIDTKSRTTDANPAMCRILGYPREALIDRSIYDFVDATNKLVFQREVASRKHGQAGGYEIALTRADGTQVDCYNQATPIHDPQGRHIGSIGMWTDISDRKRAERQLQLTSDALRAKSQTLEDTLGSISQGIASFDAQGLLQVYNQRLVELLDLPDELLSAPRHFNELMRLQQERGEALDSVEWLDPQGQPQPAPTDLHTMPARYVRRTSNGRTLEVHTRRLADGGMVRTFTDVTDDVEHQRVLAEREREQRDLLEAFPGYIVVTDHDGRYTYVNRPFADMLGRPRAQIIGLSGPEVLGPVRFAEVRAVLNRTRVGVPVVTESEYPATAWRPRTFLQVTHAISQDPITGAQKVYAFAIDISARKAAEAALVAARDEAERANHAKSQFLSNMSHELRTPLNAILGFGQLLATDRVHPLAPRQQAQMGEILSGGRHLLQLINEVLDLATVEAGRLPMSLGAVALPPLVEACIAMLQPLAQRRQITLVADNNAACLLHAAPQVCADAVRLKQVLLNLLGNAIKYTHAGGWVHIGCCLVEAGLRINVSDNGPGLDSAQTQRLFGAFERLDADSSRVEGAGLGLALSRGLMHAMQGRIGVHSHPGKGSTFWVELPLANAPTPGLASASPPDPSPQPSTQLRR